MEHSPLISIFADECYCGSFYLFLKERKHENMLEFWYRVEEHKTKSDIEQEQRFVEVFSSFFEPTSKQYLHIIGESTITKIKQCIQKRTSDGFELCKLAQGTLLPILSAMAIEYTSSSTFDVLVLARASERIKKTKRKCKIKTGNQQMDRLIKKYAKRYGRKGVEKIPEMSIGEGIEYNTTMMMMDDLTVTVDLPHEPTSPSLQPLSSLPSQLSQSQSQLQQPVKKLKKSFKVGRKTSYSSASASSPRSAVFPDDELYELKESFTKLLLQRPYLLAQECIAIATEKCEWEPLCLALVDVFLHYHLLSDLLNVLFKQEIEQFTETNMAVLFRGNSPATMIMSKYLTRIAHSYISFLLSPVIDHVRLLTENRFSGFCADGNTLEELSDSHTDILLVELEEFLNRIVNSSPNCPEILKNDLAMLYNLVEKKFPNAGQQVLGSLLFLRYIGPALCSPERFQLLEEKPPFQKTLVLVGKALISLVNGVEFDGSKEARTTKLNSFLSESNRAKLNAFMLNIVQEDTDNRTSISTTTAGDGSESPSHRFPQANHFLKSFLIENFEQLWTQILQRPQLAVEFHPFVKAGFKLIRFFITPESPQS